MNIFKNFKIGGLILKIGIPRRCLVHSILCSEGRGECPGAGRVVVGRRSRVPPPAGASPGAGRPLVRAYGRTL